MAIQKDPDGHAEMKAVVSRRLRAARKSVGLSEPDAAKLLNHKGLTQVSLAESGGRIPPLVDLVKYADAYCTSLDFLAGRINDPLADDGEHNQSMIVRSVSQVISGCFERFATAVSEQAAVCISGHRKDRAELKDMIVAVREVAQALARVRELNPEYEDWRGGSTLEASLRRLLVICDEAEQRMRHEAKQAELIDKSLRLEEVETRVKQFTIALTV
jgi:transcriptional regulator with XRE-family HTH domain